MHWNVVLLQSKGSKTLLKLTHSGLFHFWFAVINTRGARVQHSPLGTTGQKHLPPHHHFSAISTAKLVFQVLLCDIWLTEQRCRGQSSPAEEMGRADEREIEEAKKKTKRKEKRKKTRRENVERDTEKELRDTE